MNSDDFLSAIVTILTAIVGIAILAVLVSKQSSTTNVITAAGKAFSTDLKAALTPILQTGGIPSS